MAMQFISDIFAYIWAVVSSAWFLIALLLEIPEILNKFFPQTGQVKAMKTWLSKRSVIRTLAIGCLIIASFLVWHDLYEQLDPQRKERAIQQWATDAVEHCSDLKVSFTERQQPVFLDSAKELARLYYNDTQIDLNKLLLRQHPRSHIGIPGAIFLGHVEFTLQCLERNGYVKLTKVAPSTPTWPQVNSFQNIAIEFTDKWRELSP
jgi:hypothetical protein